MDIHPFVGNRETKAMAVDNILHMIGNYQKWLPWSVTIPYLTFTRYSS